LSTLAFASTQTSATFPLAGSFTVPKGVAPVVVKSR
jgi:hypothetical protein